MIFEETDPLTVMAALKATSKQLRHAAKDGLTNPQWAELTRHTHILDAALTELLAGEEDKPDSRMQIGAAAKHNLTPWERVQLTRAAAVERGKWKELRKPGLRRLAHEARHHEAGVVPWRQIAACLGLSEPSAKRYAEEHAAGLLEGHSRQTYKAGT